MNGMQKERFTNQKVYVIGIKLLLISFAMISVALGIKNAIDRNCWDFQYDSARLFLLKINPYLESIHPTGIAAQMGLTDLYGQVEANQFPSLLLLLWPYAIFSPMTANVLWTITNVMATIFIIFLVKKLFFSEITCEQYSWYVLIMLTGTPWRNVLGNGQHTLVAFLFFLLSLYSYEKGKKVQSAMLLAVSYFKYTLTVPLAFYYLFKKEYKILVYSVIPHIVLTVFSAIWLRTSIIDLIILPLKISSNLSTEGSIDLVHFLNIDGLLGILIMFTAIFFLMIYAVVASKKHIDERLLWCVLFMDALVCTYHRNYDFFVAMIPMVYMSKIFKSRLLKGCLLYEIFTINYAYWFYFRTGHMINYQTVYNVLEFCAGTIWYVILMVLIIKSLGKGKTNE